MGFCAELAHPADQHAESVGDGSVLLRRDDDGVLRAFANYCGTAARVAALPRIGSAPEARRRADRDRVLAVQAIRHRTQRTPDVGGC